MKRRKRSLPSRERGLKSSIGTSFAMIADSSLPSRERGLKCCATIRALESNSSLPSRERGLKSSDNLFPSDANSRSLRGSVD